MAPRTSTWRAIVTYAQPAGQLTDDQVDALVSGLPSFGHAIANGDTVQLFMTFETSTVRQAVDAALSAARAAYAAAFGTTGDPIGVRVLPEVDYQHEITMPPSLDLVGATEVGEMLGVSRQRAAELAKTHPLFPGEVGRTSRGPVYTRDSIAAFAGVWDRSAKGGRPPKDAGGDA